MTRTAEQVSSVQLALLTLFTDSFLVLILFSPTYLLALAAILCLSSCLGSSAFVK